MWPCPTTLHLPVRRAQSALPGPERSWDGVDASRADHGGRDAMPDVGTKQCPVTRISRLFAVLAHELRAPLSAITYTTSRLGEHAAAPDVRDACELIHRQVRQISALLNDVIDGWRIADGHSDAQGRGAMLAIDLRDVVRDGADTVAMLVEARAHTLRPHAP